MTIKQWLLKRYLLRRLARIEDVNRYVSCKFLEDFGFDDELKVVILGGRYWVTYYILKFDRETYRFCQGFSDGYIQAIDGETYVGIVDYILKNIDKWTCLVVGREEIKLK